MAMDPKDAVGIVESLDGEVIAFHEDGSETVLSMGADIWSEDQIETGEGAAVSLRFVDETSFSLGEDSRLFIDEYVYDPATNDGKVDIDVLKGMFIFISGEVAKNDYDDMVITADTIDTTVGIRGTEGGGTIAPPGEPSMFFRADGIIIITTPGGTVTLDTEGQVAVVTLSQNPPELQEGWSAPTIISVFLDALRVAPIEVVQRLIDGDLNLDVDAEVYLRQLLGENEQASSAPNASTVIDLVFYDNPIADETRNEALDRLVRTFESPEDPVLVDTGDTTPRTPPPLEDPDDPSFLSSIKDLRDEEIRGENPSDPEPEPEPNVTPLGSVTISGSPLVGQALTAANDLTDEDGLGDVSYQWQADGSDIPGATGDTLELGDDLAGALITARAQYTDGRGASESVLSNSAGPIEVPVNLAPFIAASGAPVFTEGTDGIVLDDAANAGDDSGNLSGATVQVADNFQAGLDELTFQAVEGIAGSFDEESGILTLSGVASIAAYQAALQSVRFSNSSDAPDVASRSVIWQVSDGEQLSEFVITEISINAIQRGEGIDGYVEGARAFLDVNGNGQFDEGEPFAITDATGIFEFSSGADTGSLILEAGGTDITTGQPIQINLSSTINSAVISPVTTLIDAFVRTGAFTPESAVSLLQGSAGLTLNPLTDDPIQHAIENPDSNAGIDLHAFSVATLAAAQMGASYLVAASGGAFTLAEASAAIFDATAGGLGALSYADVLASASTSLGYTPTATDTDNFGTMEDLLDVVAGEAEAVRADDSLTNVEQLTRFAQMTALIQSGLPGIPIPGAGGDQAPLAENPLIADILSTESLASVLLTTEISGTIDGVTSLEFVNLSPIISGGDLVFDSFSFDGLPPEQGQPVAELLTQTNDSDHDFDSEFEGVGLVFGPGVLGGDWFFTLDNGETWRPIPPPPESTGFAFVLPIHAEIYYQPAPDEVLDNFVGVQVVSWDGTVGENGEWVDAAPRGGATPFSSNALDVPVTLDANNTAPEFEPINLGPGIEDNSFSFTAADLLTGASDRDNPVDTLIVSNVQQTAGEGSLQMQEDGSFLFTPSPDWHGPVAFSFDVSDGEFLVAGTAGLAINAATDAVNDSVSTNEDESVSIAVLGNDTFEAGASISATSNPPNGSVTVNSDGTVMYTPDADFNGEDSFDYTVTTAAGNSESATVTVQVEAADDAVDDEASTDEDDTVQINVLANDGFGPGVSVTEVTQPDNGSVVINPDSTVSYTPGPDFSGEDSFSYTAGVPGGGEETANVSVTVNPIDDIADDDAETDEDSPVDIDVMANDGFAEGAMVAGVTQGAHGDVTINSDGTVNYSPDPDFAGTDTFDYTVLTAAGDAETATVSVLVNPVDDISDDDNAAADEGQVVEDTTTVLDVLANDDFASPVSISAFTQGMNGTVVIVGDALSYTPDPDFHGSDSFTYSVDVSGQVETATVNLDVAPEVDVVDDDLSTAEDTPVDTNVLVNDNFESAATVTAVTQGANGSVVFAANGDVTYTPDPDFNGMDSFTYTVTTVPGNTETATVNVEVTPGADVVDDELETTEDQSVSANVFSNDEFGADVTLSGVTQPSHGSVSFDSDGIVNYTPDPDFQGVDSFAYTAGAEEGTVTVNVSDVDDTTDDEATTDEDVAIDIDVLANDNFTGAAAVSSVTPGGNGTVIINSDGTLNYAPDAGFFGEDGFTYTVTNANGDQETADVAVTVTPSNRDPVAVDDEMSALEDTVTASSFALQDNDTDEDEDELTVQSVGLMVTAAGGSVEVAADGTFTYTPPEDYSGEDSFDYVVTDGIGSDTGTVAIDVEPVNDPPVANDDSYGDGQALILEDGPVFIANLRDNDTDPDGGSPLYTATPVDGLRVFGSGVFHFDPSNEAYQHLPAGETMTVTSQIVMNDRFGGTDTSELSITVTGTVDVPVAVDDVAATFEDGATISGNVLDNDLVIDDGTAIVSAEALGAGRTGFSFSEPDGSWTFDPGLGNFNSLNQGVTLSFAVPYRATDQDGGTSDANLTITVLGSNDAPTARSESIVADEGVSVVFVEGTGGGFEVLEEDERTPITGNVGDNDSDPDINDVATYAPASGQADVPGLTFNSDGSFVYDPIAGSGLEVDSGGGVTASSIPRSIDIPFNYTMTDDNGATSGATLTIQHRVYSQNDLPFLTAPEGLMLGGTFFVSAFNANIVGSDTRWNDLDGDQAEPDYHPTIKVERSDGADADDVFSFGSGEGGLSSQFNLQVALGGGSMGEDVIVYDDSSNEGPIGRVEIAEIVSNANGILQINFDFDAIGLSYDTDEGLSDLDLLSAVLQSIEYENSNPEGAMEVELSLYLIDNSNGDQGSPGVPDTTVILIPIDIEYPSVEA